MIRSDLTLIVEKKEFFVIFQIFTYNFIVIEIDKGERLFVNKDFKFVVRIDIKEKVMFPYTVINLFLRFSY